MGREHDFRRTWDRILIVGLAILLAAGGAPSAVASGDGAPEDAEAGEDRMEQEPSLGGLDALMAVAEGEGTVRAILVLDVGPGPQGPLEGPALLAGLQEAVREARDALYGELAGSGFRELRAYQSLPYAAVELTVDGVERLGSSSVVAWAAVDEASEPELQQSSPLVGADQMWSAGLDGTGIMVAILDTGVDTAHAFFDGRVKEEACFSSNVPSSGSTTVCPNGQEEQIGPGSGIHCDTSDMVQCDHGTHVAGIAAGSRPTFHGVARGADLMSIQVFSRFTGSSCTGSVDPCVRSWQSDQIAGLDRVLSLHLNGNHTFASANMSLGGGQHTSACNGHAVRPAADALRNAGIAVVASAGNSGWVGAIGGPACISSVVAVGSTTKSDALSSFSNNHETLVDLLAPGSSIRSAVPGGQYSFKSGTSMAAPHVAGAFAVLRGQYPDASVDDLLGILVTNGVPVTASGITNPRLHLPHADFQWGPGMQPCAHADVLFTGASTFSSVAKRAWDFTSSTSASPPNHPLDAATPATVTHAFGAAGTYEVSFTVESGEGKTSTRTKAVEVQECGPVVDLSWTPDPPCMLQQTVFSDLSAPGIPGASLAHSHWDFGDGSSQATDPWSGSVSHTYLLPLSYTVTLTVTDTFGQSSSVSRQVAVDACLPLSGPA